MKVEIHIWANRSAGIGIKRTCEMASMPTMGQSIVAHQDWSPITVNHEPFWNVDEEVSTGVIEADLYYSDADDEWCDFRATCLSAGWVSFK